jgi:hypothetical protein
VAVPIAIPAAIPDDEPIEATEGALLDHIPPAVISDRVMTVPIHWLVGPLTGATTGTGFTEIAILAVPEPHIPVTV